MATNTVPAQLPRWFLFLLGCIGTRLLFVIMAKFISKNNLPYLGYLALVQAVVMMYLWMSNSRLTGAEAGGKIWWHPWRISHALLYFGFAYNAINSNPNAYLYLAADVILALILFFSHYGFGYLT